MKYIAANSLAVVGVGYLYLVTCIWWFRRVKNQNHNAKPITLWR